MSDISVSAIITTYNYGRFVVEAVRSVLAQSAPGIELIVIDDGSTDDTPSRLAPYLDRVRYVRQTNAGVDAARNHGIALARGRYIGFLDADDLWHPRKIELQQRYFAENPDADAVAVGWTIDLRRGWPAVPTAGQALPSVKYVSIDQLVIRSRFVLSGVLLRKTCFDAIGTFRAGIAGAEDRDLWIRLSARAPIPLLDLPLTYYRNHGGNLSVTADRMDAVDRRMLTQVFNEVPALRARRALRRKAFSYAASMSSFLYTASGRHFKAMARIVESLWLWPFRYESDGHRTPIDRLKMLAVMALRLLRLKKPHVDRWPVHQEQYV